MKDEQYLNVPFFDTRGYRKAKTISSLQKVKIILK
jgi:hypothetical protein